MTDELAPDPPAEELDWEPTLAFLPRLTAAAADEPTEPRPARSPSDLTLEFLRTVSGTRVVAPFDWPTWMRETGDDLVDDPAGLDQASLEDCRRLLTAMVRADRFNEGLLERILHDGTIEQILRRVTRLRSEPVDELP